MIATFPHHPEGPPHYDSRAKAGQRTYISPALIQPLCNVAHHGAKPIRNYPKRLRTGDQLCFVKQGNGRGTLARVPK